MKLYYCRFLLIAAVYISNSNHIKNLARKVGLSCSCAARGSTCRKAAGSCWSKAGQKGEGSPRATTEQGASVGNPNAQELQRRLILKQSRVIKRENAGQMCEESTSCNGSHRQMKAQGKAIRTGCSYQPSTVLNISGDFICARRLPWTERICPLSNTRDGHARKNRRIIREQRAPTRQAVVYMTSSTFPI